jgi:hypothetical protein
MNYALADNTKAQAPHGESAAGTPKKRETEDFEV